MSDEFSPLPFELRRLSASDAEAYRSLRLNALRSAPEAFSALWVDEAAKPLSEFADRFERNFVFGGFRHDGTLLGIVGLRASEAEKTQHKAVYGACLFTLRRGELDMQKFL